jgi:predicted AlkP superfamily phosphohydrolase/phosphomutase
MGESVQSADGSNDHSVASRRTLVIGLSGCSWNVLDRLLDGGDLPNLARMVEEGSSGILESVVPFQPAPAWASYATGAFPGTHGTLDHLRVDGQGELRPVDGSDLRCSTYYQQLGHEGKRSILVNLPIDQHGCDGAVIVNSWLTTDESRRILPIGRRERYRRLLESYRALPDRPGDLDELCSLEEARFDLARELYLREHWDHFFVLFSSTDWLGHVATGRLLSGDPDARSSFVRLYRQLDRYIGWLVEHAPDAAVFIVSEHGQTEELALLRINTLLQRLGLVQTGERQARPDPPSWSRRRIRALVTVPSVISRYRTSAAVRPLALATKSAARDLLGVQLASPSYGVDAVRSAAFSPTDASCAVHVRDQERVDLGEIEEALRDLTLPDGRPAVDEVWETRELWGREPGPDEPALLFAPARGVRPSAAVKDQPIDFPPIRGHGCHDRDGILVVAGPACSEEPLDRVSICDLAPTLLRLMGSRSPGSSEGRVLHELLDDDVSQRHSLLAAGESDRALPFPASNGEHDEVARRLRALGYL